MNASTGNDRPITPRWEWRTFGDTFDAAEEILGGMTPEAVQETDELYIVAAGAPAIAKVRFELMDVKRLLEVDDNGLQLWVPVMKSGFPLTAENLAEVFQRARSDRRPIWRGRTTHSTRWSPRWSAPAVGCGR